jgi:hypothetical protein
MFSLKTAAFGQKRVFFDDRYSATQDSAGWFNSLDASVRHQQPAPRGPFHRSSARPTICL